MDVAFLVSLISIIGAVIGALVSVLGAILSYYYTLDRQEQGKIRIRRKHR